VQKGLSLPIFDELADPRVLARLAAAAEAAGWDGVFVWDHLRYREPVVAATDPWIALAAMAVATERIQLGPMVTPLARRRPAVVARQVVALDHLSGGRVVLGLGLGLDASGEELSRFGEETDDRERARMLDEGLEVLRGLLSGEPVSHRGVHYTAEARFLPTPARPGGMPIWLAARWPNHRPIARALRHDGVFLIDTEDPGDLAEITALAAGIGDRPFDVVVEGWPGTPVEPWAAAGATWWLAQFDPFAVTIAHVHAVIAAGPP
jgi:alkanesulfonate monooxygenase SsuD/methylene tetrahydromethanopterin reductase-like flavin-dependent oxidoreductase (luciferase family)